MGSKSIINQRFLTYSILTLHLLFSITSASTSTPTLAHKSPGETLEEACRVTRYRQLCMQNLAPFSRVPHQTPYLWARGGVVVTIAELKAVSSNLANIKSSGKLVGKALRAVEDCLGITNAAVNCLQDSLQVLRHLNSRNFPGQISDVLAWLNMAIKDEDMCVNGLKGGGGGEILSEVEVMVTNATHVTNNALALANNLASSGFST